MRGVDFSETSRFSGGGGDNGGSFISLPTLRNFGIINHDLSQSRGYLETSKVNPIRAFLYRSSFDSIGEIFEHGVSWYRKQLEVVI